MTNYAGIAVEPKPDNTKVDRVELVYIDEYLIMAIIVMDDRRVKNKKVFTYLIQLQRKKLRRRQMN